MSIIELLQAPGVVYVLCLYGHVMLLGLAYTAGTLTCLNPTTSPLKLTILSIPSILVHRARPRRLRLYTHANLLLPRRNRHLPSPLDTRRLPNFTTQIRYRRCLAWLLICMAYLLHFCTSL